MRTYSAPALAALESGDNIVAGAVKVDCSPTVLIWGGYGDITLGGETYKGIGDRGLISISAGALGDSEQNVVLSLSGVDPDILALIAATNVQRASVVIWRLVFDGSGRTLLDAQVYSRGRLDTLPTRETVGGEAYLEANVETAARGLGRSGQRMRTDADQRLINASDGGFRAVSYAGVKTLYWGGRPPATGGQAFSNGSSPRDGRFENYVRDL